MNTTKTISVMVLAAASAWAQTAASKPAAKATAPASKAAATKPASQMAPAPAKTTTSKTAAVKTPAPKAMTAAKAPAAPAKPTPAATTKKPATKAPVKTVKTAPAKTAPAKAVAKSIAPEKPIGKRDPFVSVIVARSDSSAACTGGKRCLLVDQLALRGIVRTPTKWIAMVENPARKTYYLYENDPILNAVVVRITGDSVIFRESVMDALGHATEREVVKRVNAPAI